MLLTASRYLILVGILLPVSSGIGRADLLSASFTDVGSVYTLQYDTAAVSIDGLVKTYDVFLTIDTSGYGPAGDWIKAVAIKLTNSVEDVGNLPGQSSLVKAPAGGVWAVKEGGTNSGGCDGHGSGFLCAQEGTSAVTGASKPYVWEFHYATTAILSAGDPASVKAVYYGMRTQGKSKSKSLASEFAAQTSKDDVRPESVPDGGVTLMLLGGALAGLETLRRVFCA